MFWKLGDQFPIHNPKHGLLSVETCVSRVGIVGVRPFVKLEDVSVFR